MSESYGQDRLHVTLPKTLSIINLGPKLQKNRMIVFLTTSMHFTGCCNAASQEAVCPWTPGPNQVPSISQSSPAGKKNV